MVNLNINFNVVVICCLVLSLPCFFLAGITFDLGAKVTMVIVGASIIIVTLVFSYYKSNS